MHDVWASAPQEQLHGERREHGRAAEHEQQASKGESEHVASVEKVQRCTCAEGECGVHRVGWGHTPQPSCSMRV